MTTEAVNMWGSRKSDINADEYCQDCEREVPWHYDKCPTRGVHHHSQ